jgi:uncharacterized membrane protein HdeD (DUF308 family)
MKDAADNKPNALDEVKPTETGSWPTRLYVGALVWAFVTLSVLTPSLDGPESNAARMRAQVALLACAMLRLAWALHRKEKSRGWVLYSVLLFLAAPLWLLVEQPLWSLGRALWGRGLNP